MKNAKTRRNNNLNNLVHIPPIDTITYLDKSKNAKNSTRRVKIEYDGSSTYSGTVQRNNSNKFLNGKLIYNNDVFYYNNGVCKKVKYANGDIYEGDLQGFILHGKGKLTSPTYNYKYVGEFKNDMRHGKGIYTQTDEFDKIEFNGIFENGKYKQGTLKIKGDNDYHSVYTGEFINNIKHGYGKYVIYRKNKCVEEYEGLFYDNKYYIGKLKTDTYEYEGRFINGKIYGYGKTIYSKHNNNNVNYYSGDHKISKRHGKGKVLFNNGNIFKGNYDNGYQYGKGQFIYNDKLLSPDTVIFEGVFNGKEADTHFVQNDVGKFTFSNGDVYFGQVILDGIIKPHGVGVITDKDGNKYDCLFDKGVEIKREKNKNKNKNKTIS